MKVEPAVPFRELKLERIDADLVIVGGGLAGTCAAITAARAGISVVLAQDRPVLGGNASSEVRLWALGATAHMGNNNRWAREGGVIDELLVENTFRNNDGNPIIMDTVLLEKVVSEPNIRLLLNTAAFEVTKSDPDTIESIRAFCSQNSTMYELRAPVFCDASGDGVVGFLSGAAFRMGAELEEEFGEKLAPSREYGELLGHSIFFYSKDVGRPVKFTPPSYALDDITKIPRFRSFNSKEQGCKLWWVEYGGRLDTVHETETIKWELWKVIYGVWNYIKNSGEFPDAETLTLEWVGTIPGKRESRRFEGDYLMRQHDLVEQRLHEDAVSFGGWALDLHPADGVYSEKPGCQQWHTRGVYQIPYRSLYSRNIKNLFLAGRIISVTHVAFSSSRVMLTCAHAAQAVGMAAALCKSAQVLPAEVDVRLLQRELLKAGQYIPRVALDDPHDLVRQGALRASSSLKLQALPADGPLVPLNYSWAQMLPIKAGNTVPTISFCVDVKEATTLHMELRTSDIPENYTPDVLLAQKDIALQPGEGQTITFDTGVTIDQSRYVFVCLMKNPDIELHTSETRVTGILSVANAQNPAVSNYGKQEPTEDIGIDTFEFWVALRRPNGQNLAFTLSQPLNIFDESSLLNGFARPTNQPNAWVAAFEDTTPEITVEWDTPQSIKRIELIFDTDYDHPMETVLMTHPETAMPFCVKRYKILTDQGQVIAICEDNHQTRNVIALPEAVSTQSLRLQLLETHGDTPASLFDFRCYGE
jgi:hypothetical protein